MRDRGQRRSSSRIVASRSRSARHGLSKVETSLDPSGWLIAVMERLGLVWDVVRITPERQGQKLAAEA